MKISEKAIAKLKARKEKEEAEFKKNRKKNKLESRMVDFLIEKICPFCGADVEQGADWIILFYADCEGCGGYKGFWIDCHSCGEKYFSNEETKEDYNLCKVKPAQHKKKSFFSRIFEGLRGPAMMLLLLILAISCAPTERPEQVKVNKDFVTEYTVDGHYDKMAIADMDNDGFSDIVLMRTSYNGTGTTIITVVRNVVGPWVSNDRR